jgi:hypothetical protein
MVHAQPLDLHAVAHGHLDIRAGDQGFASQ